MTDYRRVRVLVEQTREVIVEHDVDAEEYHAWLGGDEHHPDLLLEFLRGDRDYPENIQSMTLPDDPWAWNVTYNEITGVEA